MKVENNYFQDGKKSLCCGCGTCIHICPVDAISMVEDEHGYIFPDIDKEKCIDCGLCQRRCPLTGEKQVVEYDRKAYMAIHKVDDLRKKSASGGAFVALAHAFSKEEGAYAIFGAQYNDDLSVCHTYITDYKDIEKYQKSKYVQSSTNDSYVKCKEFLENGYRVLFSGTPCQIAGLKRYLNKDYDKLITTDLICHGVPSYKIFNSYLKFMENELEDKIVAYTFRHKVKGVWGNIHSRNCLIQTLKKKVVKAAEVDLYLRGYHEGLFYRESCYECRFACPDRVSDITLGDYWNIHKIYPEYDALTGISGILVNSAKGQELVEKCSDELILRETKAEEYINNNSQLREPSAIHKNRDKFFELWKSEGFDAAINACTKKLNPVKLAIRRLVPTKVKRTIKGIIKKI